MPQDAGRVTQITEHHADLVAGREQRPAVRGDHGIVVDIDHPRVRRHPLGQFVHVSLGRQAAAEVQTLPDTALDGQVTHHPAEKRPLSRAIPATSGMAVMSRLAASRSPAKLSLPLSR